MGAFISTIVRFFINKPFAFVLFFLGTIGFLIGGILKLNIDEDLYSIFPKGEEYQKVSKIIQENAINRQILFSIDGAKDLDKIEEELAQLESELSDKFEKEIIDLKIYQSVNEKKLIRYLQRSSFLNFTNADYAEIDKKITNSSIEKSIAQVANKLEGTNAIFLKHLYANDPLGITFSNLQKLNPQREDAVFEVKDDLLFTKKEQRVVFFGTLTIDSKNTDKLQKLNNKLADFKQEFNRKNKSDFDYFGTFQITVENAQQVKSDTYVTSLISVGAILLLLVIYYKSIFVPLLFVLPAGFGMLSGLGLVGYLNPNISAISLATSSVLLGIVLDYTFHFYTHYRHSGSIIKTIEEISTPMIVGSFTTVAGLGALLFANSVILQNFGLIALFTLIGAVLYTLLFQPVLLSIFKVNLPQQRFGTKQRDIPKIIIRFATFAILLFTIYTVFKGVNMSFDADINNLSHHPEEIKKKELLYTGLNPSQEKKIYVVAKSNDVEKAKSINSTVYDSISSLKSTLKFGEILSTAPYLPSNSKIKEASSKWINFWSTRKDSTVNFIRLGGKKQHFSENAFQPFFKWVNDPLLGINEGETLASAIGLDKLNYSKEGEQTFITSIVVDKSDLESCKKSIRKIEGVYILDFSELTQLMLDDVQSDFNFLLMFSALLVFITLLLLYGRIELAIFAFLPMIVGWILILGITDLFHIQFNFVNIVITTFIFGLGDDFSIFSTDGLLQKYRTGTSAYQSFRSAIILSGITTIIGTGVLIFAIHPAINSIALISVIGILTIMFISLYVQPMIFNFFVLSRIKKGKSVITFFTFIYSILLFCYFFIGSLLLNIFLIFILIPLPIKKRKKRSFLNYLVSRLAKSTLYAGFYIKKRMYTENMDYSKPKIIIANHSSFLDILMVLMIHPKTVIMVKSWVYNSPIFGLFIRYAGYPFANEGASQNSDQIKRLIDNGYSVVIFPEGTRSRTGEMGRFHKGAFLLAQELKLDIQPVLLIGANLVNPKNDFMFNRGHLIIKSLDPIQFDASISYQELSKKAKRIMLEGMKESKNKLAETDYWWPFILKNYIYKGPVLEWYVRVKWNLERKNFEFYDRLIGDRKKIYDLGCGYGYLSYYLHYRNSDREILGIDYDEQKVELAENAIKMSPHLKFSQGDIRNVDFEAGEAVFFNDVLHYLPSAQQYQCLENVLKNLNEDGIIFIRDGLKKEQESSFMFTKMTEFLSTKVFHFNKANHKLEFISEDEMRAFASKHNLTVEIHQHSKTTSNVLLILRKS